MRRLEGLGSIGMRFKVNEIFHSIQGVVMGPVREREARTGALSGGQRDPGVVRGAPRARGAREWKTTAMAGPS